MTLTEMRYIVALARERHFGRAAEACHVSQPTLSVALKKVEGQIGTALFERTANDVRITALGERIVDQARRVLEEAVKLEEIAESTGDPMCGQLRVGIIYTIAPYLLPQLIPALSRQSLTVRRPFCFHDLRTMHPDYLEKVLNAHPAVSKVTLPLSSTSV